MIPVDIAKQGPVVSGDFDADGYDDFLLYSNAGLGAPVAVENSIRAGGLRVMSFRGHEDPQVAIEAAADTARLPIHLITGAASGDLNADGYDDVVLSAYNAAADASAWALAADTAYVLAWYGGPSGIDPTSAPAVLHTENKPSSADPCDPTVQNSGGTSKVIGSGVGAPRGMSIIWARRTTSVKV